MKIITGKTQKEHVNSEDDRALHAGTFGKDSYVLDVGTKLKASIESSNTIRIDSGEIVHQGTHARIPHGSYDTAMIDNGTTGFKRKDIIAARYERNGGFEDIRIITIKGQPSVSGPIAPDYEVGNILEGADISDMPLYEVTLDGVNIEKVTPLFAILTSLDNVWNKDEFLDRVYPVGAIYMSVNNVNPGKLFGGTWKEWGGGCFPRATDSESTELNRAEITGGEDIHKHEIIIEGTVLTIDQMPAHSHTISVKSPNLGTVSVTSGNTAIERSTFANVQGNTSISGGDQPHTHNVEIMPEEHIPPFITCYMWKRIS